MVDDVLVGAGGDGDADWHMGALGQEHVFAVLRIVSFALKSYNPPPAIKKSSPGDRMAVVTRLFRPLSRSPAFFQPWAFRAQRRQPFRLGLLVISKELSHRF